jgi:PhzF family phenazine biosynthesis protein
MKLDLTDARRPEQYQVDAFAEKPFSGNPAAVVFEHRAIDWMQKVGAENNLAETAFVSKRIGSDSSEYDIRW